MANPSPQHNPTDGLGTAAEITMTSGDGNFQIVAAARLYKQQLSVSGATINGVVYGSTVTLTAAIKDIGGNAFTSGNSNTVVWKSYDTSIATVVAGTGAVTAVAKGQVILEAQFATFDQGSANAAVGNDKVYAQVILQVYP